MDAVAAVNAFNTDKIVDAVAAASTVNAFLLEKILDAGTAVTL